MLKHNKKTNAGIVFEQLLATTTRLAASGNVNEARFVMSIIKNHFAPQTNLGKERKLIDAITSPQFSSKEEAVQVFEETLKEAATINPKELEREKQALITSVNKNLGQGLYNIKIPKYKDMASAQILFNEARNGFVYTTPQERVQAKNTLLESMTKKVSEDEEEKIIVDNLTLKLAVKKFNKKYSKMLNEDQQEVLKAYMMYKASNNSSELESMLKKKVSKISTSMNLYKNNKNCTEVSEMLTEAIDKISQFDASNINEESVYEVMRYFDLVEDLEKVSDGEGE